MLTLIKKLWTKLFSKKKPPQTVQTVTAQLMLKEMDHLLNKPLAFTQTRPLPVSDTGKTIKVRRPAPVINYAPKASSTSHGEPVRSTSSDSSSDDTALMLAIAAMALQEPSPAPTSVMSEPEPITSGGGGDFGGGGATSSWSDSSSSDSSTSSSYSSDSSSDSSSSSWD